MLLKVLMLLKILCALENSLCSWNSFMRLEYAAVSLCKIEVEWNCYPQVSSSRKVPDTGNLICLRFFFTYIFQVSLSRLFVTFPYHVSLSRLFGFPFATLFRDSHPYYSSLVT